MEISSARNRSIGRMKWRRRRIAANDPVGKGSR